MTPDDDHRVMADALRMVLARVTGREEASAHILVPPYLCCAYHSLVLIDALLAIASVLGRELEEATGDDLAERFYADLVALEECNR